MLDIGLPDSDGRDVCQALRAAGQLAPVLFLTARTGVQDIVTGFHAGGDDYLGKPFALAEVLVRVGALARRGRPEPYRQPSGLRLDPQRFTVARADLEIAVTPTEFRMLAALLARPGEVVRRRDLVAAAWPHGAIVAENTVDSYVRRLRRKLELLDGDRDREGGDRGDHGGGAAALAGPGADAARESPASRRIETVRGVGYALR
ncbi:response regulator transcription factor [Cryobacterium sp. 10C3]|uniref:response regulator transcription factor n=1 Tax=Cryobacterium sp. 10C3 TaxID=3048577 RepID=UPI002AB33282|nr:response regulator transcription factor [Cryobacterium sp. 10C3]MDY7558243.1 response regulator transcription factor [Cryobacterium sp. 10C3]